MRKILDYDSIIVDYYYFISDKVEYYIEIDKTLKNEFYELFDLAKQIVDNDDIALTFALQYIIFDYKNGYISQIQDDIIEKEILQNNIFGIFEIIEKTPYESMILLGDDNKKYKIVGSTILNEKGFHDLNVGDIIITRLIFFEDNRYFFKNYNYFLASNRDNNGSVLKIMLKKNIGQCQDLKYVLQKVLEFNKIMSTNNKDNNIGSENVLSEEINHIKRIKKIFIQNFGKKFNFNKIRTLIDQTKKENSNQLFAEIAKYPFDKKDGEQIMAYLIEYLNKKNISDNDQADAEQIDLRKKIIFEDFADKMNNNLFENQEKMQESFENRCRIPNYIYSGKTPEQFVQEIEPDFVCQNLQINRYPIGGSEIEKDFYDGYPNIFTQEEHDLYKQAIGFSKKEQFKESLENYEILMKKHSNFFRLEYNYLITKANFIMEKFKNIKNILNLNHFEEIYNDLSFLSIEFVETIQKIKKQKPDYHIWDLNIETHQNIYDTTLFLIDYYIIKFHKFFNKLSHKNLLIGIQNFFGKCMENVEDFTILKIIETIKKNGNLISVIKVGKLKNNKPLDFLFMTFSYQVLILLRSKYGDRDLVLYENIEILCKQIIKKKSIKKLIKQLYCKLEIFVINNNYVNEAKQLDFLFFKSYIKELDKPETIDIILKKLNSIEYEKIFLDIIELLKKIKNNNLV